MIFVYINNNVGVVPNIYLGAYLQVYEFVVGADLSRPDYAEYLAPETARVYEFIVGADLSRPSPIYRPLCSFAYNYIAYAHTYTL